MTAMLTDTPSDDRLERVAYLSLLGFAAALQVSIAAANILLGLTALLWLVLVMSRRERVEVPSFFWWLAAYAGWTIVAALFSIAPATSIISLQVLDGHGVGTDASVIRAIERAIELRSKYNIKVINHSG